MAARGWLKTIAGLATAAVLAPAAAAQNYDGDMLIRFGAFGQGTFLNFDVTRPAPGSASANGLAWGGVVGIDYHPHPHWLIGFEFDASLGDARGQANGTGYGLDYMATLRGRFGVHPRENWLLYGTAGFGFLGFEAQQTAVGGTKGIETVTGLLVGVGAEYSWHHVILFGEYDYATFGSRQFTINNTRHEAEADAHLLRFGIKFKVGHDHFGRHYDPK